MLHQIRYALARLNPFHRAQGQEMPNPNHLADHRRVLLSPFTQTATVFALLKDDPAFLRLIPQNGESHLILFSVNGYELRANLYQVKDQQRKTKHRSDQPLHDDAWFKEGIYRYLVNREGVVQQVTRRIVGYYYDPFDPLVSYARPLTVEEEHLLENLRVH